jgi:hypothetical protein
MYYVHSVIALFVLLKQTRVIQADELAKVKYVIVPKLPVKHPSRGSHLGELIPSGTGTGSESSIRLLATLPMSGRSPRSSPTERLKISDDISAPYQAVIVTGQPRQTILLPPDFTSQSDHKTQVIRKSLDPF